MRVLHVITDPELRGAQVFARELSAELVRRGVDSHVVALGPARPGDSSEVPVLGRGRRHPGALAALRRQMEGVDVVVAHGSTTLPMCVLANRGRRRGLVYRQIGDTTQWTGTLRRRLQTRLVLRRTACVVALWESGARMLSTAYGVHPSRVRVIPNAASEARWQPPSAAERGEARQRLGINPESPVLAYAGALAEEKRVSDLIRALGHPGLEDWHLVVVGDGSERDSLESLSDRQAPGRVTFTGRLVDVRGALCAADVVALVSRTEAMPAILIEAGLMGIPTVATDVGAVSEVIDDGRTGFIVPVGDVTAIAAAIALAGRAGEGVGIAARAHCTERYSLRGAADRWYAVLEDVAR